MNSPAALEAFFAANPDAIACELTSVRGSSPRERGTFMLVGLGAIFGTIGGGALIGLHATVLNRSIIGEQSLIAAGALVKEGQEIPAGVLAAGVPAKVVRELDDAAKQGLSLSADHYVENARNHATLRTQV